MAKSGKRSAYRPGREASIIRRLLRRHKGALPPQTMVRLWRELLAGTTAMQGPFAIAVCEPDGGASFTQAAREHFGALTPLHAYRQPGAGDGRGQPRIGGGGGAANAVGDRYRAQRLVDRACCRGMQPRMHVVGRLPFWAPRPDGAPAVQALVIATTEPDQSERDRSCSGCELDLDVSRARLTAALTAAGLPPRR